MFLVYLTLEGSFDQNKNCCIGTFISKIGSVQQMPLNYQNEPPGSYSKCRGHMNTVDPKSIIKNGITFH